MLIELLVAAAAATKVAAPDSHPDTSHNACSLVTPSDLEQSFHVHFGPAQAGLNYNRNNRSLSICHYEVVKPDAGITSITFQVDFGSAGLSPDSFQEGLKISGVTCISILDLGVPALWCGPQEKTNSPAQLHVIEKNGKFHLGMWINSGEDEKAKFVGASTVMRAVLDKISRN